MKRFIYLLVCLVLVTACGDSKPEETVDTHKTVEGNDDGVIDVQVTDFNDDDASIAQKHLQILEELDICVLKDSLGIIAECSSKDFKIVPFKKNTPIEDAFILEMKAGIRLKNSNEPLPPIRHILVFERIDGALVKVNGFRGDLIATQDNSKANDLILGLYVTKDETLFHCKYVYDGERYVFTSVDRLDYGEGFRTLNEASREEMTQQIYNDIIESNLIF